MSGCGGWQGLNSLPLPGVQGRGPGAFTIQAQMPDVDNIEPNSRVRVADVTVGNVTKIERQGWHALVTMELNGDVQLPANATAKLGQTSLLGSLHIELAPPTDVAAGGQAARRLADSVGVGEQVSEHRADAGRNLAAAQRRWDRQCSGHHRGVQHRLDRPRGRPAQPDRAARQVRSRYVNDQKDDIIAANESLNNLVGQFAEQKPVVDKALRTIPDALAVLKDQRNNLAEALAQLGKFSALAADSVNQTKEALVQELKDLGPVLEQLANAGPALTRALSFLPTFPFPKETLTNWMRGDYANLSLIVDLTLSRIDQGFFTGTRWECDLTWLELQWGRTIGQFPSPCNRRRSAAPPATRCSLPYRWDQGP